VLPRLLEASNLVHLQAVADSLIGTEIENGEYRVLERIGVGGMGSVYKAEQPSMNRLVAIKVLHPRFASRDDLVSRFRREARAMSQLSHPNTARVYKFGQLADGSAYFVMDYMEGTNLAHVVRTEGPMEPDRALNIMIQVCAALEEAHRAGIIHRDLKPENIFLTHQAGTADFPKVLDFGLAKVSEKQMGRGSMMLTQQGMIFGTPEFMSPEQSQGDTLDRRSDIYSLGLIAYELLTGKLPFEAEKPLDIMRAHVQEEPIPLNKRTPERRFAPELEQAIGKAIARNRDHRHETAADFAKALRRCLKNPLGTTATRRPDAVQERSAGSGRPESNRPGPAFADDPIELPLSRGPLIAIGVGAALLLLAAGAFIGSLLGR
jgi:eukaryotic-like serine/threonine-protein kinase